MKKIVLCVLCLIFINGCQKKEEVVKSGDKTPPWINVEKYVFETSVGASINFDTAVAFDDVDGPCDVVVRGTVNFQQAGEYYLKYISKDTSGNISEEAFTVLVQNNNVQATSSTVRDDKTDKLCDATDVNNASKPCEAMISDASYMKYIFQDENGLAKCKVKGDELVTQGVIETYQCDILLRNDQKIWGYGLISE